jgi:hypothetical protein
VTSISQDQCGATSGEFYFYDVATGEWNVSTVGIRNLKKGIGYWFLSEKRCDIMIAGSGDIVANDIVPQAGWNQIGSPTYGMTSTAVNEMKNRCKNCGSGGTAGSCSSMKIFWYNPITKDFDEVSSLEPGKGYQLQCIA